MWLVSHWRLRDGTAGLALFNLPSAITTDAAGNLYVADSLKPSIRRRPLKVIVTTIAGDPTCWIDLETRRGSDDGVGKRLVFDPSEIVDLSGICMSWRTSTRPFVK